MSFLIIFALLSVFGLAGAVFLVGSRVSLVRYLDSEEKKARIDSTPAFFEFVKSDIIVPFEAFMANAVRPALFKLGEKFLRRFRLFILKTEAVLQRRSNYFRGKRIAIKNGNGHEGGPPVSNENVNSGQNKNSDFWDELHKTKEELKNNGNLPR